jgi:hypothetical protein
LKRVADRVASADDGGGVVDSLVGRRALLTWRDVFLDGVSRPRAYPRRRQGR